MDFAEPLIKMKIEQRVFDASAKIVKTADEMLGTLMDTSA
jgi:flagellar hook protein FlgE